MCSHLHLSESAGQAFENAAWHEPCKKILLKRIDHFVKVAEKILVPTVLIGIKTTLMFSTSRTFSTLEFENSDGFCAVLICWAHRNSFSFFINIREAVNVRDINEMYSLMNLGICQAHVVMKTI